MAVNLSNHGRDHIGGDVNEPLIGYKEFDLGAIRASRDRDNQSMIWFNLMSYIKPARYDTWDDQSFKNIGIHSHFAPALLPKTRYFVNKNESTKDYIPNGNFVNVAVWNTIVFKHSVFLFLPKLADVSP